MPLTANFLADFSSFINACRDATTSTDQLVEAAGKVGATLDQAVAQAAGNLKNVGSGIVDFAKSTWAVLDSQQLRNFAGDVTTFVSHYVNEFGKAEQSNARLEQSLKNAGLATPDVTKAYEDMATSLSKISTFSSGAIKDAMALFTTIGKIGPEAMKSTLEATMNLAAYWQTDLTSASAVLVKAMSSNGEALGRLKSVLGDSYVPGMSFAQMMDAVNSKFAGQYSAQVKTTAGALEQVKNQMAEIDERIGASLAGNLKTLLDLFQSLPEPVQNFAIAAYSIGKAVEPVLLSLAALVSLIGGGGLIGWLTKAGTAIVEFGGIIGTWLLGAFEGLAPILIGAGEAIATFVGGLIGWPAVIIAAIVALAAGIYYYWDEIVAFLGKAVDKIKGFLTQTLPAAFNTAIETVKNWYYQTKYWLYDQFVGLVDLLVKEPDRISDAFKWMFNNVVGFSYVPDMINGIASEFGRLDRVMIDPALAAVDDVNAAFSNGIAPLNLGTTGGLGIGSTSGPVNVTVNMSGMLGTDDPQTRSMVSDLVSAAVMQGMRGGRLLGTA